MILRFPLPPGYFPPIELSPDETLAHKELVAAIVKKTRTEYDQYVGQHERKVDPRKWTLTKSKSVASSSSPSISSSNGSNSSAAASSSGNSTYGSRLKIYKRRSEFGAARVGLTGLSSQAQFTDAALSHTTSSAGDSCSSRSSMRPPALSTSSSHSVSSSGSHRGERSNSINSVSSLGLGLSALSVGNVMHRNSTLEPTALVVGTLDGTVDDLVFALHESSVEKMQQMCAFLGDDSLVDAVVLAPILCSRTTYLGLKWRLVHTPGGNRDMCYIEYVGVANDSKGVRYGFRVVESVLARNCPPFEDKTITRADTSFCYLFRETRTPGVVDVYAQGAFDSSMDLVTAGGVGDLRTTTEQLLIVARLMERAESKKLAELVAEQAAKPPRLQSGGRSESSALCALCSSKPGFLSSNTSCQTCGRVVCSKCRVKRTTPARRGSSSKQKITSCKSCVAHVVATSPFANEAINDPQAIAAARKEREQIRKLRTGSSSSSAMTATTPMTTNMMLLPPPVPGYSNSRGSNSKQWAITSDSVSETEYSGSMPSSSMSSMYSDVDVDDLGYSSSITSVNGEAGSTAMVPVMSNPTSMANMHYQQRKMPAVAETSSAPPGGYSSAMDRHRLELYNQMIELQLQAEKAYSIVNQNSAYMQHR